MKFKAAIFDMDGTLVDSLMVWDVLWSEFGKKYLNNPDFTPTPQDDKAVRTLTLKAAMELIHKNYGMGENGEELLAAADAMLEEFYKNSVELKPGVEQFLQRLYSDGTRMCIASATDPRLIDLAIKRLNLDKYFREIFSCGTIGKGKDQPDIFVMACDYLGQSIKETWLFEDSLTAIETATTLGMPTVGIYDRYNFGQESIRAIANHYIDRGETLMKLI